MRILILTLTALSAAAGCDDTSATQGNNKNDLSMSNANRDLSVAVTPDQSMAAMPTACGAVYDCIFTNGMAEAGCLAAAPAAAASLYTRYSSCYSNVCGLSNNSDAGTGAACKQDGGAMSAGCDTCITNTTAGPMSPFVDSTGARVMCMPTSASECGVCVTQLRDCFNQCFTDADCAGFTTPLHCMNGACG